MYICTNTFTAYLGDRQEMSMFTCNTRDRKDDYLVWLHNKVELSVTDNSKKYTLSNTRSTLTVRDVDHEDEGNYSCKYTNRTTDRDVYQEAGCLIVYGKLKHTVLYLCTCTCTCSGKFCKQYDAHAHTCIYSSTVFRI